MVVNFLILMFILNRFLFQPVLKIMDQRAEKIRESVEEAERARAEAQRTIQANQSALDEARKQASDLLAAATHTAAQIREQANAQAREEAERLVERARAEIALERDRAIAEVTAKAVDLVILTAGKVIDQTLTAPQHYELVNKLLAQAEASKN